MNDRYDKFWSQYETVSAAAAEQDIQLSVWPPDAGPGVDVAPEYVYEHGWVLMREDKVADASVHNFLGTERVADVNAGPVKRVRAREQMLEVMSKLSQFDGSATPHHLVSICADVNMCPADEPYPLPADARPWPPVAPDEGGQDVTVTVIDTGLVDSYLRHDWMAGVYGDTNLLVDPRKDKISVYGGHGTFIAGLVKSMAPRSAVRVTNDLPIGGTALELGLGDLLSVALTERPDIISLSAGSSTQNRRELLGLSQFLIELRENDHTLLVAAAGNEGTVQALMPASLGPGSDGMILSVGALRADHQGIACFSNYGPAVQVYAPGERLTNAFADGDYRYADPPRLQCRYHDPVLYCPCTCVTAPPTGAQVHFDGMARWSGTSFATPIVAGWVAALMTESPQARLSPRAAARKLLETEGGTVELPQQLGTGVTLVPASMRQTATA